MTAQANASQSEDKGKSSCRKEADKPSAKPSAKISPRSSLHSARRFIRRSDTLPPAFESPGTTSRRKTNVRRSRSSNYDQKLPASLEQAIQRNSTLDSTDLMDGSAASQEFLMDVVRERGVDASSRSEATASEKVDALRDSSAVVEPVARMPRSSEKVPSLPSASASRTGREIHRACIDFKRVALTDPLSG